ATDDAPANYWHGISPLVIVTSSTCRELKILLHCRRTSEPRLTGSGDERAGGPKPWNHRLDIMRFAAAGGSVWLKRCLSGVRPHSVPEMIDLPRGHSTFAAPNLGKLSHVTEPVRRSDGTSSGRIDGCSRCEPLCADRAHRVHR